MTLSPVVRPTVRGVVRGVGAGGAISSPTQIANLALWFDASDASTMYQDAGVTNVVSDTNEIYRWYDKAGGTLYVENTLSGERPQYRLNIQNGLSVARGDGTDHLFNASQSGLTSDAYLTVFSVSANTAASALSAVWSNADTSSNRAVVYNDNRTGAGARHIAGVIIPSQSSVVADYSDPDDAKTSAMKALTLRRDGTDLRSYFNGVLQDTETLANTNDTDNEGIRLFAQHLGASKLAGDIAEVVVYEAALSDTDRQRVEDYLNTKWAIY